MHHLKEKEDNRKKPHCPTIACHCHPPSSPHISHWFLCRALGQLLNEKCYSAKVINSWENKTSKSKAWAQRQHGTMLKQKKATVLQQCHPRSLQVLCVSKAPLSCMSSMCLAPRLWHLCISDSSGRGESINHGRFCLSRITCGCMIKLGYATEIPDTTLPYRGFLCRTMVYGYSLSPYPLWVALHLQKIWTKSP